MCVLRYPRNAEGGKGVEALSLTPASLLQVGNGRLVPFLADKNTELDTSKVLLGKTPGEPMAREDAEQLHCENRSDMSVHGSRLSELLSKAQTTNK